MTFSKRIFDLLLVLAVLPVALPVLGLCMALLWWADGRPLLFASERMRAPNRPFTLWKLRTMRPDPADRGVSGGDKADRITPFGAVLRRHRLDELPQLWNVLRGDLSLVGPRPPLRRYVERFPALYAAVLRDRPGVTGLATLVYHRHEERLLRACATAGRTEDVYCRRCVPRKARIDLIYQRRRSLWMDLRIVLWTAVRILGRG